MCDALPAFHALTGSDYTPAFNRKGKVRPFTIMVSQPRTMLALARLGHEKAICQNDLTIIEEFVCSIYGATKLHCKNVDEARVKLFQKSMPKKGTNKLSNIKSIDPAMLPPCFKVLKEKIERTNLIAHRCLYSYNLTDPWDPLEHGWIYCDGKVSLKWFEGDAIPKDLDYNKMPSHESETNSEYSNDVDEDHDVSDIDDDDEDDGESDEDKL